MAPLITLLALAPLLARTSAAHAAAQCLDGARVDATLVMDFDGDTFEVPCGRDRTLKSLFDTSTLRNNDFPWRTRVTPRVGDVPQDVVVMVTAEILRDDNIEVACRIGDLAVAGPACAGSKRHFVLGRGPASGNGGDPPAEGFALVADSRRWCFRAWPTVAEHHMLTRTPQDWCLWLTVYGDAWIVYRCPPGGPGGDRGECVLMAGAKGNVAQMSMSVKLNGSRIDVTESFIDVREAWGALGECVPGGTASDFDYDGERTPGLSRPPRPPPPPSVTKCLPGITWLMLFTYVLYGAVLGIVLDRLVERLVHVSCLSWAVAFKDAARAAVDRANAMRDNRRREDEDPIVE